MRLIYPHKTTFFELSMCENAVILLRQSEKINSWHHRPILAMTNFNTLWSEIS